MHVFLPEPSNILIVSFSEMIITSEIGDRVIANISSFSKMLSSVMKIGTHVWLLFCNSITSSRTSKSSLDAVFI